MARICLVIFDVHLPRFSSHLSLDYSAVGLSGEHVGWGMTFTPTAGQMTDENLASGNAYCGTGEGMGCIVCVCVYNGHFVLVQQKLTTL